MSVQLERRRQRELLRQLPREFYAAACSIEPWLRDSAGATGLCEAVPQYLAVTLGIRGIRFVGKVLVALAELRPDGPDKPAIATYDPETFVWYWTGGATRYKPKGSAEAASWWKYAQGLHDCPARQACLNDLRPAYEALVVRPEAKAARKAAQGDLPLPRPAQPERQPTNVEWRLCVDEWLDAFRGTDVRTPGAEGLRRIGSLLTQAVTDHPSKDHWRLVWTTARRLGRRGRDGLELRPPGLPPVSVDLGTILATADVYDWLAEQAYLPEVEAEDEPAQSSAPERVRGLVTSLGARLAAPGTGPPR